ncbi:putative isomerase YbhE [Backusella circina FSU 941]|nr:putative isomerase YbhE [Backusella circina FSU 941]
MDTLTPVYVSGYASEEDKGIYQYEFNSTNGTLTRKGCAAVTERPSYFCFHKSGQRVYAVNEVPEYNGEKTGYVSCFLREKETGTFTLLNEKPSGGEDPCHAVCDATGSYLLVANYNGGSCSVFPIDPSSHRLEPASCLTLHQDQNYAGTLGVPDRQEKPHCHSIDLDPIAQQYAFSCDLGSDVLVVYKFDRHQGTLAPHSDFRFPKGAGPRHLKFVPNNNNFCYVVSELSNDVYMLEFNFHEGKFYEVQRIHALPDDFTGENLASEIEITPNSKFLYVSMRGHDTIAIFRIDERTGKLSLVGHHSTGGKHPRHFTLDPTGNFILVANKDSNNLVVLKINNETGLLEQVSTTHHVEPTCIQCWA